MMVVSQPPQSRRIPWPGERIKRCLACVYRAGEFAVPQGEGLHAHGLFSSVLSNSRPAAIEMAGE